MVKLDQKDAVNKAIKTNLATSFPSSKSPLLNLPFKNWTSIMTVLRNPTKQNKTEMISVKSTGFNPVT